MGKIFYIMGKSASGKDTIYKELIEKMPKFHSIVPYTTRPMREGEKDGVEYFFVDQERFDEMMDEEKIIEFRPGRTTQYMESGLILQQMMDRLNCGSMIIL